MTEKGPGDWTDCTVIQTEYERETVIIIRTTVQAESEVNAMKPVRPVGSRIRTQWTAVSLVHL